MIPFEIVKANNPINIIATIPHSGTYIPYHTSKYFTLEHYSSLLNTDFYIDLLYEFLPQLGITLIKNNIYRYVIDVNRELTNPIMGSFFKSTIPNTIPLGTPHSWNLYKEIPNEEEINYRIENYYTPFLKAIDEEIELLKQKHSKIYLLDLHSFVGGIEDDITIGNRDGKTCNNMILDAFCSAFKDTNYNVSQNNRFKGGHIIKSKFAKNQVETCIIEVKAACFINPNELDKERVPSLKNNNIDDFRIPLKDGIKQIIDFTKKLE